MMAGGSEEEGSRVYRGQAESRSRREAGWITGRKRDLKRWDRRPAGLPGSRRSRAGGGVRIRQGRNRAGRRKIPA